MVLSLSAGGGKGEGNNEKVKGFNIRKNSYQDGYKTKLLLLIQSKDGEPIGAGFSIGL